MSGAGSSPTYCRKFSFCTASRGGSNCETELSPCRFEGGGLFFAKPLTNPLRCGRMVTLVDAQSITALNFAIPYPDADTGACGRRGSARSTSLDSEVLFLLMRNQRLPHGGRKGANPRSAERSASAEVLTLGRVRYLESGARAARSCGA